MGFIRDMFFYFSLVLASSPPANINFFLEPRPPAYRLLERTAARLLATAERDMEAEIAAIFVGVLC